MEPSHFDISMNDLLAELDAADSSSETEERIVEVESLHEREGSPNLEKQNRERKGIGKQKLNIEDSRKRYKLRKKENKKAYRKWYKKRNKRYFLKVGTDRKAGKENPEKRSSFAGKLRKMIKETQSQIESETSSESNDGSDESDLTNTSIASGVSNANPLNLHEACTKIQAAFRGVQARQRPFVVAELHINPVSSRQTEMDIETLNISCRKIQAIVRGAQTRRGNVEDMFASSIANFSVPSSKMNQPLTILKTKVQLPEPASTQVYQSAISSLKQKSKQKAEIRENSAKILQANIRGASARATITRQNRAASSIQAVCRGFTVRKEFRMKKSLVSKTSQRENAICHTFFRAKRFKQFTEAFPAEKDFSERSK